MKKPVYFLLLATLFTQLQAQWASAPPFGGYERDGAFSFVIDNTVYMGGGILSNDLWKLNNSTQNWDEQDSIGDGQSRCFSATFTATGMGYIVGGDLNFGTSTDEVWKYNPATDTWQKMGNFPGGPRVGMVAFAIGNRVFAGGGTASFGGAGFGAAYDDLYEYMHTTDTWTLVGSLPHAAGFASTFVISGKAYMVFGSKSNSEYINSLHRFDVVNLQWTELKPFPGAKRNAGVAYALNGKGYAGLGQSGLTGTFTDFYEYDPATDNWTKLADYPEDKSAWSTAFVYNNKGHVGTGANLPNLEFSNNLYTLSATTGVWEVAGKTPLQAYPNPFSNQIILTGLAEGETVTLTDMTGKQVAHIAHTTGTMSMATAHLPAGIYLLHTANGVQKLVKE